MLGGFQGFEIMHDYFDCFNELVITFWSEKSIAFPRKSPPNSPLLRPSSLVFTLDHGSSQGHRQRPRAVVRLNANAL